MKKWNRSIFWILRKIAYKLEYFFIDIQAIGRRAQTKIKLFRWDYLHEDEFADEDMKKLDNKSKKGQRPMSIL